MLISTGLLRGKERVAVVSYIVEEAEGDSNSCDERVGTIIIYSPHFFQAQLPVSPKFRNLDLFFFVKHRTFEINWHAPRYTQTPKLATKDFILFFPVDAGTRSQHKPCYPGNIRQS
jgi:hypothetical protein